MTNYDEILYRVGGFLNVKFTTPDEWDNAEMFAMACEDMENIGMTMERHDRWAEPFGADASKERNEILGELELADMRFEDAVYDCYNDEGDNEHGEHVDWIRDAAVECNEIKAKLDRFAVFEVHDMGDVFTVTIDVDKYNEATGTNKTIYNIEYAVRDMTELYAAIANGTFYLADIWEDGEVREDDVNYAFPVAEWEPTQNIIAFCREHGYPVGNHHDVVLVDPDEVGDAA